MSERFQSILFIYLRKNHLEMFLLIVNILLGQVQIQGDVKFVKLKISGSGKWQVAVWKDKDRRLRLRVRPDCRGLDVSHLRP